MSSNMQFIYNTGGTNVGTVILNVNPQPYDPKVINIDDNNRMVSGALNNYHKAVYNHFELTFQNIGTQDFTNLKAIFDTHQSFKFYPYDEARGTALCYTCLWMGDFDLKFVDSFWSSGFTGLVIFETV